MAVIFRLGGRAAGPRRLERRWCELWARVGAEGDPRGVFRGLDRRYREPGRHYHNWEHIGECLEALESAVTLATDAEAVEAAVWFHDAVYDPRAGDNEERSAALAREDLRSMGLPQSFGRRVAALILATRVGSNPEAAGDEDTLLIADVDLSILGRPWGRYRRYERDIRREYAWVPAEEFRRRRGALLQGLLDRPRLYSTELFRARCETQARANLSWSLRRLGFPRPLRGPGAAGPRSGSG